MRLKFQFINLGGLGSYIHIKVEGGIAFSRCPSGSLKYLQPRCCDGALRAREPTESAQVVDQTHGPYAGAMGQRRVMGEMSARAAVAFFELCSFNRSRCLVGGVDWHSLRVQRVGRCMVQLGGTIALLRVEQIWVGTESASREMICWNQRREMLRWQSSENHLRRLPPRDWRRSAMSSSAGAPSRAALALALILTPTSRP